MNFIDETEVSRTMLPWFIWREIIYYTVDESFEQLCLVNKEWFEVSAGQFIVLDSRKLTKDFQPPYWLKLAENFHMYKPDNFEWGVLDDFTKVRYAEIDLSEEFEDGFTFLKEFICKSKIHSISLTMEEEKEIDQSIQLLLVISKRLYSLEITCDSNSYDKLIVLNYSKLEELIINKDGGFIFIDSIHKFMLKLEELEFHIDDVKFSLLSTNVLAFLTLKKLKIKSQNGTEYILFEEILGLFKCYFPNLKLFYLEGVYYQGSIELIPQNMPSLKKLDLNVIFRFSAELKFPAKHFFNLEEFCFCPSYNFDENSFQLDLAKLPKLRKLRIVPGLGLINSIKKTHSVVEYVEFREQLNFTFNTIYNQLFFLNEIEISFPPFNAQYMKLFQFCKRVKKLTINEIHNSIPVKFLPHGPFKTTLLKLMGKHFLNNDFIHWLAQEFQLTHLTIKYFSKIFTNLKPVVLPSLQKLDAYYSEIEADTFYQEIDPDTYLQSILLLPPS